MGRLPADQQEIVRRELKQAVMDQRADEERLDATLKAKLESEGMVFVPTDKAAFRAALKKTSFYTDWKTKFGEQAWSALETVAGTLT
jgi:TRAP-type C4-dicarboxylate transport system substrate-binding protein